MRILVKVDNGIVLCVCRVFLAYLCADLHVLSFENTYSQLFDESFRCHVCYCFWLGVDQGLYLNAVKVLRKEDSGIGSKIIRFKRTESNSR